jgi:hydrogenase expression/formation protein HypC
MCLAIPGRVEEIDAAAAPVMGKVRFGGIRKDICLELTPDVKVGEYVIVHVGFAISKVDENEALETIRMFAQMGENTEEELGSASA